MRNSRFVFLLTLPVFVAAWQTALADQASLYGNDEWHTVGYWNYDGVDGQHLPQGLVLRPSNGAGLGRQWKAHLELKDHKLLPRRVRTLWPVKINTEQRKVCADYEGYPSYQAFIDMPGEAEDGFCQISKCTGG